MLSWKYNQIIFRKAGDLRNGSHVSILVILEIQSDPPYFLDCLRNRRTVSILVILEIQSDLEKRPGVFFMRSMFQSLLSWKYNQIIITPTTAPNSSISFNPCYLGNTIRSSYWLHGHQWEKQGGFNPCYLGNTIRSNLLIIFQSDNSSFNPCYLGNTIRSLASIEEFIFEDLVSILVILEIQSDRATSEKYWTFN